MKPFRHIASFQSVLLLLIALIAPIASGQVAAETMSLPAGVAGSGDAAEVGALIEWADAHRHSRPEQAEEAARRALALAGDVGDQRGVGQSLILLGNLATSAEQKEAYYAAARDAFERIGDERGLIRSRLNLGNVNERRGALQQALTAYFDALEGLVRLGETEGQAVVLHNIGTVHRSQGNVEEALAYFERAAGLAETVENPVLLADILNSLGTTYSSSGAFETAEVHLRRALAIVEDQAARRSTASISNNLGFVLNKQGRYEAALPFLLAAERLSKELEEDEYLIGVSDELGKVYLGLGQYARALHHANESLRRAREAGLTARQMDAHQTLARIYEAAGNDRQALAHYKQYAVARDAVFNAEKARILTEMQTRYATEEKQRAIEYLEQENRIRVLQLTLLLAGAGGLVLVLGALFYRYRLKQRANRLLEEINAAKTRFFANISHEFRTPLTLLLGPLRDQTEGVPPSQQTAEIMLRNARRLERLVDQLLELERIDAGHLVLHRAVHDLAALVGESVGAFRALARQKNVEIEIETGQVPVPVHVDVEHIDRVVGNLLSNAVKFTPAGGRVGVVLSSPPPELVVEDTGPGIPPEWRERIFDRFAQMSSQATRDGEGAGLGLALSREIVSLHQGVLFAEAAANGGARFVLRLPLAEAPREALAAAPVAEKTSSEARAPLPEAHGPTKKVPAPSQPRVLVAEDQGDLRRYIASVLSADYAVEAVEDGEAALAAVQREPPDAIVSDIVMPRRDGFALARALRAEPEYAGIPLIFLTARTADRDEIEGLAIGADQYVKKPFQRDVLLAHVAAALRTCRRLREHLSNHPSEPGEQFKAGSLPERARAWVENNIHQETLSVEDMAAVLHMSRTTLFRRLVAEAGLPPSEFIRAVRLTRARLLLEASAGNISEVAYAVGFNSLAAFSRAYRTHYGVPPSTHLGSREATSATCG